MLRSDQHLSSKFFIYKSRVLLLFERNVNCPTTPNVRAIKGQGRAAVVRSVFGFSLHY